MLVDCAAAIEAGGARVPVGYLVGYRRVFTRKWLGLPHKSGTGEGAGA